MIIDAKKQEQEASESRILKRGLADLVGLIPSQYLRVGELLYYKLQCTFLPVVFVGILCVILLWLFLWI